MTDIWLSVALIWVWLDVALFPEEPGTADATPAVPMVTGLAANTNANTNASTVVTMVTPDRRLRNERPRRATFGGVLRWRASPGLGPGSATLSRQAPHRRRWWPGCPLHPSRNGTRKTACTSTCGPPVSMGPGVR